MRCPRCQVQSREGARFCEDCGARLTLTCAACGEEVSPGKKFCGSCGVSVAVQAEDRFASPQSYTPKYLAEKILTSRSALAGERKQVTVLFADLKGSMELLADRDPEEARGLLDPVLERLMEAVHRYEGTVNQIMGDGIMALFGAPLAHEDHAIRACYAALRMQGAIRRHTEDVRRSHGIEVRIRVGLNSGEVVVRSIGNDLHMDYTAVGQTAHLAARMEQLAPPGSIWLTAGTLQLATGLVQVNPLGPIPVKGLEAPVEIYELTGAGPARRRLEAAAIRGLTRFVARQTELDTLRQALDEAHTGHGQLLALVGEPGVGKSRLFWEFTRSHRTHGWLVLESSSVSYGKATSYLPVIDLLKSYFQTEDRDDQRKIREKVTGKLLTLDEALKPVLPAFLALLEVQVDDPQWLSLDPSQRRQRTLDAVKRLLVRESQIQPLCLVFEDLHWIDSETQALLDSLIDSLPTARILLLVNYRPEYQHAWGSKTYYTQLRIDPLPPESADELLRALLGNDAGLQPLKQLLIARTEGNPFFLEESVRTLVETQVLLGEPGAYRLAKPLRTVEVPATVRVVLAARIDRLPPEEKALLQTAAIIGKDVPFALLHALAEMPEEELRGGLTRLQAAEFLYESSLFPEPEYTFKHALTHEVVYGSLLQDRRRVLHGRVVEALERLLGDRASEHVELLAHHALRGEVWERAARYLHLAGERAVGYSACGAAASFYEAAVEAIDRQAEAGDLTLKLDAYLELWVARIETGQHKSLRELAEKAEGLARLLNDKPRLAQLRVRQAQGLWLTWTDRGTLEAAIERAREAASLADPRDLRTRSYARFVAGAAHHDLGRFRQAISELDAGTAMFAKAEPQSGASNLVFPIYVSLSSWRAQAHAALGEFQQGVSSVSDGLRVANQIGHPTSLAFANALLGYIHTLKGDVEAALPVLERGLVIAEENDLTPWIVASCLYLGYGLLLLGQRERGLNNLTRALQVRASAERLMQQATRYETVPASAHLLAGQLVEAQAEIAQGLSLATAHEARAYQASLLRLQAEILARQEPPDLTEPIRCLQQSIALATELGMRPELAHCHLGLGKLYGRTGDRPRAQEHLTTAATLLREMDMRLWLEQAEAELKQLG